MLLAAGQRNAGIIYTSMLAYNNVIVLMQAGAPLGKSDSYKHATGVRAAWLGLLQ